MTTIGDRYPELTQLHHEFIRALCEDPAPKFPDAFLWYQAINFQRDPLKPSATSRGHEALCYLQVIKQKSKVPGQSFEAGKTPKDVCSALISRHAADLGGPFQINFRYHRDSQGIWSGFYSIETSAQHRDIVAGRAAFDEGIAEALREGWQQDIVERMLTYGLVGDRAEPIVVNTRKSGAYERLAPEGKLQEAWLALEAYLKGKGVQDIYVADFTLTKPTARLRDGDNAQVIYGF